VFKSARFVVGLIEVEFSTSKFALITQLVASAAPIPLPQLSILDPSRLIAGLEWGQVTLGPTPDGVPPPSGQISCKAELAVRHVSLAELAANSSAQGTTTPATAWLLISAAPGRLDVKVARIDGAGSSHTFSPPQIVDSLGVPLPALAGQFVSAAVLLSGGVVTLRFASAANDDLLGAPANRLDQAAGDWLIRVAGEIFSGVVLTKLAEALNPPPAGATVEDAPTASWTFLGGPWGAYGTAGVEKEDACPGLFGDVDVSVEIQVRLTLQPNVGNGTLGLGLHLETNASDWDSFRCWLGSGGIGSLLVAGLIHPLLGIAAAIVSLVAIAEVVRHQAGDEVEDQDVGAEFVKTGGDEQSADYKATMPLPAPGRTGVSIDTATVGPSGLIVSGTMLVLPATHDVAFTPVGGSLEGTWHGSYSCESHRWEQDYLVPGVEIRDTAKIITSEFKKVPVTVFSTSSVAPAGSFEVVSAYPPRVEQYARIDTLVDPAPGLAPMAFLHTSAGIRRFDIGPVPAQSPGPDGALLAVMDFNCHPLMVLWPAWMQLFWLVDPPPFVTAHPALRQWMLAVEGLPPKARIAIHGFREETDLGILAEAHAEAGGSVVLEVITEDDVVLRVDHNLVEVPSAVRFAQRWLMPIRLERREADLDVGPERGPRRRVHELQSGRRSLSVTLPDGRVLASWAGHIVLAIPSLTVIQHSGLTH
jgi:hypothetical protein